MIYSEHLDIGESIQHIRVIQLADMERRPWYQELTTVESESSDKTYLVGRVEVLTKPFVEADTSEDRIEILVCSCDDYYYHQSKGLENGEIEPQDLGECKHCRTAFRTERARNDNQQDTLL